ncbi:MAG TPA: glycosyltransferase family 2 protein [Candidatus Eisenbacteria bacterium]|nr:glycosyltransferase family 2 protein [Candidatus Eisenbacteria bacterium]
MNKLGVDMNRPELSIVIPVYNEEAVLPALRERLCAFVERLSPLETEIILVDDHSSDQTPQILKEFCEQNSMFRYARLAKNCGSHVAVLAGLARARGECAVFLAADLQDPPELILQMMEAWRQGHHIVWAVREQREGVSGLDVFLANTFYRLLNFLGEVNLPPRGSDFALLDRKAVDALLESAGSDVSLGGEIARLGFSSQQITYTKERRAAGTSKWTLQKKLKAVADAFVSFSYAPLRAMSYLGIICSLLGFAYALLVIIVRLKTQTPVQGWASLIVVVLVLGGLQMMMLGVLGEYLWRTLEAARHRPIYFLEDVSDVYSSGAANAEQVERVERRFGT